MLSVDTSYLKLLNDACPTTEPDLLQLLAGERSTAGSHYFLPMPQFGRVQSLLEELEQTLLEKSFLYELTILRIMSEVVFLVVNLEEAAGNDSQPRSADELLVGDVLAYLVAHCQEEIRIEDLLWRFPVSRSL
ncbi:hypothetical protein [Cohnella faecalis]|nr:hypothetical protein [Cohnella faecalis]